MNSWIVLTYLDTCELMKLAVEDATKQEGLPHPPRVLAISNGSSQETRREAETTFGRMGKEKVLPWFFEPALPSLSAVWNRGLRFCWNVGADEVLVTQADVRLTPWTYRALKKARADEGALLVTATGVTEPQWLEACDLGPEDMMYGPEQECPICCNGTMLKDDGEQAPCLNCAGSGRIALLSKGGPGYSCFLITRECHERFPFDEKLTPVYAEDCDQHRQILLAGEGQRAFGLNVPYLHHGGGTLKAMSEERRAAVLEQARVGAYAHYARKWGGPPNAEKFIFPFNECDCGTKEWPDSAAQERAHEEHCGIGGMGLPGVTNPELYEKERLQWQWRGDGVAPHPAGGRTT